MTTTHTIDIPRALIDAALADPGTQIWHYQSSGGWTRLRIVGEPASASDAPAVAFAFVGAGELDIAPSTPAHHTITIHFRDGSADAYDLDDAGHAHLTSCWTERNHDITIALPFWDCGIARTIWFRLADVLYID